MSANAKRERRDREHGRELARRFMRLVSEIVTAPPLARSSFDDVIDELGPWFGLEKPPAPAPAPPPVRRPFEEEN